MAIIFYHSKYKKRFITAQYIIILKMSKIKMESKFGQMTFTRNEQVKKGEEKKEVVRQYHADKYFKEGEDRSVCRVVQKTNGKSPRYYVLKRKIMPLKDKKEEEDEKEEGQQEQQKVQLDKELNKNIQIFQSKDNEDKYQYLVRYIRQWYQTVEGREQRQAFLLMEYCPNGDLSQYQADIQEQSLTPQQITYIIYRVLCGLRVLNRMNIMHRDIKLENIVFDRKFQPKIADMELAWRAQSSKSKERPRDNVGTYDYQAPEVINPDEEGYNQIQKDLYKTLDLGGYNYNVDVYSLGCVLFRLLFPYSDIPIHKTPQSTILNKIKEQDQFLHELAKEMFEKNRNKRKDASQILQEQKFKKVFATINAEEVQKSLAEKKLGKKKVFVKKVYQNKIGFLILLSNCKAFIYYRKQQQDPQKEEVTHIFQQILEGKKKNQLSKNNYLFALLPEHPEAIQDYCTMRTSQEYQFIHQNQKNSVFGQVIKTTINAICFPKESQFFVKLSNGVQQCFFYNLKYCGFYEYLSFNSFRDSKSRVEVASTNSFISKQVKKSSNIPTKMSDAHCSKTFSSINQAMKAKKTGKYFVAVQKQMKKIFLKP